MAGINLGFQGCETVTIDGNGRFKLTAEFLRDFLRHTAEDVVLYCLPEGAIGIYPPAAWGVIRQQNLDQLGRYAQDLAYRRLLRHFGSHSSVTQISGQGRITLPPTCRTHAGLQVPGPAILSGNEVGVEVWNPERYAAEELAIGDHLQTKGDRAMRADLGDDSGATISLGTSKSL